MGCLPVGAGQAPPAVLRKRGIYGLPCRGGIYAARSNHTGNAIYRETARRSARFYALRAASGADGSLRPQARFGAQPPHSGGS